MRTHSVKAMLDSELRKLGRSPEVMVNLATKEKWRVYYAGLGLGESLAFSNTVSTSVMPSVDGRIYSFQTIRIVDPLLGALSIRVSLSGTQPDGLEGSATGILFSCFSYFFLSGMNDHYLIQTKLQMKQNSFI